MDFKGKKLLILGANPETAGLVIKAREMGVNTVVTDYDPNAYAKRYASKSYNIDAVDVKSLYRMAMEEEINGVLVGVAESLLSTYEKLCKILDLPCYGSEQLFNIMADKAKFKTACRKYNVPVVTEYNLANNPTEEEIASIPLPVVIKPVDNCSSKGISVCCTIEDLKNGIKKALVYSKRKKFIIEKYMTGDEVVIYYIIQDSEPFLVGMCDRYTNKEQAGVAQLPTAYIFPSRYLDKYIAGMDNTVKFMLRNIGMKNGPLFIQSFIENGEVRFYEPGFRLNGAQEHYIVNAISGLDAKELMIHYALTGRMSDEKLALKANPNYGGWGCKLSPLVMTGQINTLKGLGEIAKIPEVISINPSYDEKDTVIDIGTLKQIICRFFIIAKTKERLAEVIDIIHSKLIVLDTGGQNMMLTPFDTKIIIEKY
jgi:biotin carboxylase